MNYEWLIFDADGTLFDYTMAEHQALQNSFEYFACEFHPEYISLYHRFNKKLWDDFELGKTTIPFLKTERFRLLLQELNIPVSPALFSDRYLYYLSQGTQLINGADRLLEAIEGKAGMILMTNGIKEVQRSRLQLSPIGRHFSDIIISDEVGAAKPDKKIFEIAMTRLPVTDKKKVLMIGDNLSSDIKGGVDFGMPTCWYNPQALSGDPDIRPDHEIRRLEELLPIVGL